jgi:CRISPR-associated protein Cmr4
MIGLIAETAIHPGQGQQQGVLDHPVARESWTDYPYIPGSAVKGAFREKAWQENWDKVELIFGSKDYAGELGFSDARLLLLPVRSLNAHYYWVTCPYLLDRFQRDLGMIGMSTKEWKDWEIPPSHAWGGARLKADELIYLEEFFYHVQTNEAVDYMLELISPLIYRESIRKRLPKQVVVISDDEFHHYAMYGLPVQVKNKLTSQKTSNNVWQEENIPPDTLFYALVMPRLNPSGTSDYFLKQIETMPYLQIGGNESTGLGWLTTHLWKWEGRR